MVHNILRQQVVNPDQAESRSGQDAKMVMGISRINQLLGVDLPPSTVANAGLDEESLKVRRTLAKDCPMDDAQHSNVATSVQWS